MWGATGSIGRQTLDVISRYHELFKIVTLTSNYRIDLLFKQAKKFSPKFVIITGEVNKEEWEDRFKKLGIEFLQGKEGLLNAAGRGEEDLVVNALVGSVGLEATMQAIKAGTSIALANKEVLVMAGEIVTDEVKKRGVSLLPIDSEHSAIFQCLQGEHKGSIRRILLTASGGPFLYHSRSDLDSVTVEEALAHPNWSMGKKVTIDSATLVNKGLEVIEARWLFDINASRVEVVIHPQSIIHSMVEFVDGSVKAQMGLPDMRIPISYALTYPERLTGDYGWMDFSKLRKLEFLPPDTNKYPTLRLAYEALEMGGTAPAVLNAADEIAVDLFLSGRITFTQISQIIESSLERHKVIPNPQIDEILQADMWTKEIIYNEIIPNL